MNSIPFDVNHLEVMLAVLSSDGDASVQYYLFLYKSEGYLSSDTVSLGSLFHTVDVGVMLKIHDFTIWLIMIL